MLANPHFYVLCSYLLKKYLRQNVIPQAQGLSNLIIFLHFSELPQKVLYRLLHPSGNLLQFLIVHVIEDQ